MTTTGKRVEETAKRMAGRVGLRWLDADEATRDRWREEAANLLRTADTADDHVRVPRREVDQWRRALAHEDANYVRVPRNVLQEWADLAEPLVAEHIERYLDQEHA